MTAYIAQPIELIPDLDKGIGSWVEILRSYGVETYESCQGGKGHSYLEPTIRFFGTQIDGFHALAVARNFDLPVAALRRIWTIEDGEPVGPNWEIVFWRQAGPEAKEQLAHIRANGGSA